MIYDYIYNQVWHDHQDLVAERYRDEIAKNQTIKFVTKLDNSYQYIRIDPADTRKITDELDSDYNKQFYLIINGFLQPDGTDPSKNSITVIDTLDDAIMRFYEMGDYPVQTIIE